METRKSPIYGNWKFYHPEGALMFYSDQRKAKWYLSRGLAVKIGDKEVRLTFVPNGRGAATDVYGSSPKDNVCVVCGLKDDGLNSHHIVPRCYRRFFPEEYKSKNSHDVVAICEEHHIEYEDKAQQLKNKLGVKYGEATVKKISHEDAAFRKAKSFLHCLMDKDKHSKIPKSRLELMESEVKRILKISELPQDPSALFESIKIGKRNATSRQYGKTIVSKLDSIQEFVEMWRNHFVKTMRPKFMPEGWKLRRDARQPGFKTNSNYEKNSGRI